MCLLSLATIFWQKINFAQSSLKQCNDLFLIPIIFSRMDDDDDEIKHLDRYGVKIFFTLFHSLVNYGWEVDNIFLTYVDIG